MIDAQLRDAQTPCLTAGRRSGEMLLAAAAGKLTWPQILTGAVTGRQLEAAGVTMGGTFESAPQNAAPCSVCCLRSDGQKCGALGQDGAEKDGARCWRLPAGGHTTLRRIAGVGTCIGSDFGETSTNSFVPGGVRWCWKIIRCGTDPKLVGRSLLSTPRYSVEVLHKADDSIMTLLSAERTACSV